MTAAKAKDDAVFNAEERKAIRDTARERRAQAKVKPGEERAAGEAAVQAAIADLPEPDRSIAQRLHQVITTAAPVLVPRTFYGSPGYSRDGKTVCYFQVRAKYKARYHTFGFLPDGKLDEGDMWPIAFAIDNLTPAVEARVSEIVKKGAR
jgi:uncharacterized protein YdhG (YjbR/CyaY superfamily)